MDKMLDARVITILCFLLFFLGSSLCIAGKGLPAIEAFPKAKDGEIRHVIYLNDKVRGEEENFKVELIPGKVAKTDGVNAARVGLSHR